jgi:bifunctional non-homologous end joining protein LigD
VGPGVDGRYLHDERMAIESTGDARERPGAAWSCGSIIGGSPPAVEGYRVGMATEKEILQINGREVTVSNPCKVYFPDTGHTKLDLVNYYLAVADGALRGAGGRPMALKRFVDGAAGQPFFQKRAPENLPEFIRTATLTFPSGRTADEIVIDDAAGLAWVVNLGCIDLNPHPVRAEDLDHPDELRVDLDPVPGVPWSQIREVALACRESLEAVGLVGWPKTSGSRGIHINVRIEPSWTFPEVRRAALALARDVERRVPGAATSKWWKEERHGVFLDYNQNAKDRTVASAYSIRPLPDARVSTPLTWDEVPTVEAEAFTIDTVPTRYAAIGDPGAGIDEAVGSLEGLLALSARDEAEGLGDAPWPPNYAKQAGEPPRVQPSKARRPPSGYEPGRGKAGGPPPEVAEARQAAVAAGDPNAGLPTEWAGSRPTPTGRRKSAIPVVEIARAELKDEAIAGLERWKARHPEIVGFLEPADILVDSMRGRSMTWTRVRVNLIHVPEGDRPAQEALESDYDPWAGQDIEAWRAATAGPRARKPGRPGSKPKA